MTYNASATTIHFAFLMPFNKSSLIPLRNEMLDALAKLYQKLRVVLIDEASLTGSCFLYCIDDWVRNIKHFQTKYFGNIDMIFCGDFYQARPIKNMPIF